MEKQTEYDSLLEQGHACEDSREFDEAIKYYEKAANLHPQKSEAWLALYAIYMMQFEAPEKEIFYLKRYLEIEPQGGMYFRFKPTGHIYSF